MRQGAARLRGGAGEQGRLLSPPAAPRPVPPAGSLVPLSSCRIVARHSAALGARRRSRRAHRVGRTSPTADVSRNRIAPAPTSKRGLCGDLDTVAAVSATPHRRQSARTQAEPTDIFLLARLLLIPVHTEERLAQRTTNYTSRANRQQPNTCHCVHPEERCPKLPSLSPATGCHHQRRYLQANLTRWYGASSVQAETRRSAVVKRTRQPLTSLVTKVTLLADYGHLHRTVDQVNATRTRFGAAEHSPHGRLFLLVGDDSLFASFNWTSLMAASEIGTT